MDVHLALEDKHGTDDLHRQTLKIMKVWVKMISMHVRSTSKMTLRLLPRMD